MSCFDDRKPALMFPCDARDQRRAYAREVPARAKCTGTNSIERDAGVLENAISAPQEDGDIL